MSDRISRDELRIELAEKDRQLQALRRQFDDLEKEKAEKDQYCEKIEYHLMSCEERVEIETSRLAKRLEKKEREIERLEDELEDLELSTNPEFIKAMTLIDEGLRKSKIDIDKVKKITKLLPDDEPTPPEKSRQASEAEVQKVKPDCLEKAKPSDKGTFGMVIRRFQELEFRLEQIEEQIWPKPEETK